MTLRSRSYAILLLVGLLAHPSSADAQTIRLADGTHLQVSAAAPAMLSGTPGWWRDSVAAGWAWAIAGADYTRPANARIQGSVALKLRVLRTGRLYSARVSHSSGEPRLDSLLLAAAWTADRALAYPKFPPGMEGGGADVELSVTTPYAAPAAGPPAASEHLPAGSLAAAPTNYEIPALAPGCDETLATPNAEARLAVRLSVEYITRDTAEGGWARGVMAALAPGFQLPRSSISAMKPKVWLANSDPRQFRTPQSGLLLLTFAPEGRLRSAKMGKSTTLESLDSLLVAAAWSADSAGRLPAPPAGTAPATLDLTVTINGDDQSGGVTLATVTLNYWNAEIGPTVKRMGQVSYPPELRAGQGGRVTLEFVIGTDGKAIPGSVVVVSTPGMGFADAARHAILTTTFEPGKSRDCAVPVLTRQSINFAPGAAPIFPSGPTQRGLAPRP